MRRALLGAALATIAAPALARVPTGSVEARVESYNRCMMLAAVRASYTDAASHRIYGIARAACAAARNSRAVDRARQPVYLAAVDAADAARAAHLAGWVAELRERRRASEAASGMASH